MSEQGVEVWSGGVNTWECDEMGHMNVRFYVAKAVEGLATLAALIGMPEAFCADANSTLLVREQHIRFLKEAHAGAALHMVGGVVEMGESEARLVQLLIHSNSGEIAASFQTVVVHATARDGVAFPWSDRTREKAAALAAYLQCLGRWLRVERPFRAHEDDYLVYTFNRFQACRFGVRGEVVDPGSGERMSLRDSILKSFEAIELHAMELQAEDAIRLLRTELLGDGNDAGWLRQRQAEEPLLNELVHQQTQRWAGGG